MYIRSFNNFKYTMIARFEVQIIIIDIIYTFFVKCNTIKTKNVCYTAVWLGTLSDNKNTSIILFL